MTSASRWERVRSVFHAALERNPAARDAYLSEACGSDEALRSEVRSLLAAHADAGGFLETVGLRPDDVPSTRPSLTLQPGARLGRYEITGALGAGGMGEVYRALDTQLGREVAIKILPPAFAADPQRLARFERESRVLASLKHPNIATIYSFEDAGGLRLLVLELVEGPTLAERLTHGPVPLHQALDIGRQLAGALEAAHARGIVHRDLKPANVKVSSSGHVTLLDFGLAKAGGESEGAPTLLANAGLETTAGLILGTWSYMSPEQARGRPVDQRTDIWAFGCVLFELLTGRAAFRRDTASDTIAAVLEREPAWAHLPADTPSAIRRLLERCLEKDPAGRLDRIGDAGPVIHEALQRAATGVALDATALAAGRPFEAPRVSSAPAEPGPVSASRVRRAFSSRARAAVVLATMTVALVIGGWYLVRPTTIDSLAVLPFETRSSDPDTEYLGDELAENLLGQMSRIPSLTVMARATTARFRGAADPRDAGRSLGVDAVLSGTVSRRGDRLVVAVELIDVRSGARLWGDTFDGPSAELLRVQDQIVGGIADGLRLGLDDSTRRDLVRQGTSNPQALELVMRARHLLRSDSEDGDLQARQLFEQASALDSGFVEAHLGIAATYLRSASNGYSPPADAQQRAEAALARVLALDPGNVRARAAKASLLYQRDWNWVAAEREFRALIQDPRLYLGIQHHAAAMFFFAIGRPAESAAIVERALETDPGNLESRVMLCDFLKEAGRLDEAAGCYRAVASAAPADSRPLFGLAEIFSRRADVAASIETLRSAYERSGDNVGVRMLAGARTEDDYRSTELAVARARLEDLRALATERYVSPLDLARLHAQTGARDVALAALEQALAERAPMLVLLKADRAWDGIRDDPRFVAVVRRVGIP